MDQPATDENTALKELERLQEQIQHYRAQRKAVDKKFEQFVTSFKATPDAAVPPPPPAPAPPPPAPAPPAHAAAPPAPAVERASPPAEPVAPSGVVAPSIVVETAAKPIPVPPPLARRQSAPRAGLLIGGALALLAGGALVTWTLRPRAPESSTTGSATPVVPPALPAAPEPAPAATVANAASESALTTTRAVWVRVIADGARVLERELPPNARAPLKAEKTIVIRTGDAGAISLTLRGQDQGVLGRTGEVVTRTFTVPAAPVRR